MGNFLDSTGAQLLWNKVKTYILLLFKSLSVKASADSLTIMFKVKGTAVNAGSMPAATETAAGVMTADDKSKLDRVIFGPTFHIGGGSLASFSSLNQAFEAFLREKIALAKTAPVLILGSFDGIVYGAYQCVMTNENSFYITFMGGGVGNMMGGNEPSIITIDGGIIASTDKFVYEHCS